MTVLGVPLSESKTLMRYRINGLEIRSENAAKPVTDGAEVLISWLSHRAYTPSALDFGCGKLRYTGYLAAKSSQLGILDSAVQLDRIQTIGGEYISVRERVTRIWPRCRVHVLEQFWMRPHPRYDFVLCANVLSAIPCTRARAKSLRSIRTSLSHSGHVLFVNQHSNSYFEKAKKSPNAVLYLDGWIMRSRGAASYYGMLDKDLVIKLVRRYGFRVDEAWARGQSNYVLASKGTS